MNGRAGKGPKYNKDQIGDVLWGRIECPQKVWQKKGLDRTK